jgi:hypothetical protein
VVQSVMEEVRGANRRRTLRSGCTCQGVGAQSGERHARLPSTKIRIRNVVVEMQEWEGRMSDSRAISLIHGTLVRRVLCSPRHATCC